MSYTMKAHNKRAGHWTLDTLNYRTTEEAYNAAVKEMSFRTNIDRWMVVPTDAPVNAEFVDGKVYDLVGPQHSLVRGEENASWKSSCYSPMERLAQARVELDVALLKMRESLDDAHPRCGSMLEAMNLRQTMLSSVVASINRELAWRG